MSSIAFSALTIGGFLAVTSKQAPQKNQQISAENSRNHANNEETLWWTKDHITWSIGSMPSEMDRGDGAPAPDVFTRSQGQAARAAKGSEPPRVGVSRPEVAETQNTFVMRPQKDIVVSRPSASPGKAPKVTKAASAKRKAQPRSDAAVDYVEIRERFAEVAPPALTEVTHRSPRRLALNQLTIWLEPMDTQQTTDGFATLPQISPEVQAKIDSAGVDTQVGTEVASATNQSSQEALTPAELAKLDAELDSDEIGSLTTHVFAMAPVEILYPRMDVDFEGSVLEAPVDGPAQILTKAPALAEGAPVLATEQEADSSLSALPVVSEVSAAQAPSAVKVSAQLSLAPNDFKAAPAQEQTDMIRSGGASSRTPAEESAPLESEPMLDAPNFEAPPMDVTVAPTIPDTDEVPISTSFAALSRVDLPEPAHTVGVVVSTQTKAAIPAAAQAEATPNGVVLKLNTQPASQARASEASKVSTQTPSRPPKEVNQGETIPGQMAQGDYAKTDQVDPEKIDGKSNDQANASSKRTCSLSYVEGFSSEPVSNVHASRRTYDEMGPETGWVEVQAPGHPQTLFWQTGCYAGGDKQNTKQKVETLSANSIRGFELMTSSEQQESRGMLWVSLPPRYTARVIGEVGSVLTLSSDRKLINAAEVGSERRAFFLNVAPGVQLLQISSDLDGVSFSTMVWIEPKKLTTISALQVINSDRSAMVSDATLGSAPAGIPGTRIVKLGTDAVVDSNDRGMAALPDPAALAGHPVVFETLQPGGFKFRTRLGLQGNAPVSLFEMPAEVIEGWISQLSDGERPGVRVDSGMAIGSVTALARRSIHKEFKISYRRLGASANDTKAPETYALTRGFALNPDAVVSEKNPNFATVELAPGTWILEVRSLKTSELLHSQIVPISPAVVNMLLIE